MMLKKKKTVSLIVAVLSFIFLFHIFGFFLYILQTDFNQFNYPIELDNLPEILKEHRRMYYDGISKEQALINVSTTFNVQPLIHYGDLLVENKTKCLTSWSKTEPDQAFPNAMLDLNNQKLKPQAYDHVYLTVVVKSALTNRHRRDAIRKSWGNENQFKDNRLRTVFSLGSCDKFIKDELVLLESNAKVNPKLSADQHLSVEVVRRRCSELIKQENELYWDIIQNNWADTYFNNTIKTMIGICWAINQCANSEFYLLVDDDYYMSMGNMMRFLDDLSSAEKVAQSSFVAVDSSSEENLTTSRVWKPLKFRPFEDHFYGGFVFNSTTPCRHQTSKWFIDLNEYPFSRWPPYVTAGMVLLSHRTLLDFHLTAYYTMKFRFDDIFLSILALKNDVKPTHMSNVYFYRKDFDPEDLEEFKSVIGSHGYNDPIEMLDVWNQNQVLGYT